MVKMREMHWRGGTEKKLRANKENDHPWILHGRSERGYHVS